VTDQATEQRIAETALKLLESGGEDGVSMRRVATAVGITPMAIYHHFADRRALLNFVVDREFTKYSESLQATPRRGTYESQILTCMDAYIDYAFAHPRIFDYVFAQPRPGARRFPEDFRARRSPTLNPVADLLHKAMEAGYLKQDDVWEVAMELWAHTHGYVSLYRGGRFALPEKEFRALVRRSIRRMIHGLKA
jgi:AcrR family transcriptional regulator